MLEDLSIGSSGVNATFPTGSTGENRSSGGLRQSFVSKGNLVQGLATAAEDMYVNRRALTTADVMYTETRVGGQQVDWVAETANQSSAFKGYMIDDSKCALHLPQTVEEDKERTDVDATFSYDLCGVMKSNRESGECV